MWSVIAVSSHPIVSNGTRRVTGSDADGLLSEDKKNGAQGGVRGLWGGVKGRI